MWAELAPPELAGWVCPWACPWASEIGAFVCESRRLQIASQIPECQKPPRPTVPTMPTTPTTPVRAKRQRHPEAHCYLPINMTATLSWCRLPGARLPARPQSCSPIYPQTSGEMKETL